VRSGHGGHSRGDRCEPPGHVRRSGLLKSGFRPATLDGQGARIRSPSARLASGTERSRRYGQPGVSRSTRYLRVIYARADPDSVPYNVNVTLLFVSAESSAPYGGRTLGTELEKLDLGALMSINLAGWLHPGTRFRQRDAGQIPEFGPSPEALAGGSASDVRVGVRVTEGGGGAIVRRNVTRVASACPGETGTGGGDAGRRIHLVRAHGGSGIGVRL